MFNLYTSIHHMECSESDAVVVGVECAAFSTMGALWGDIRKEILHMSAAKTIKESISVVLYA